jgi:hypothetical protein
VDAEFALECLEKPGQISACPWCGGVELGERAWMIGYNAGRRALSYRHTVQIEGQSLLSLGIINLEIDSEGCALGGWRTGFECKEVREIESEVAELGATLPP